MTYYFIQKLKFEDTICYVPMLIRPRHNHYCEITFLLDLRYSAITTYTSVNVIHIRAYRDTLAINFATRQLAINAIKHYANQSVDNNKFKKLEKPTFYITKSRNKKWGIYFQSQHKFWMFSSGWRIMHPNPRKKYIFNSIREAIQKLKTILPNAKYKIV